MISRQQTGLTSTYTPAHYRIFFPKTRHIAPEKPYIPHRKLETRKSINLSSSG